jgi:hypothetical protein
MIAWQSHRDLDSGTTAAPYVSVSAYFDRRTRSVMSVRSHCVSDAALQHRWIISWSKFIADSKHQWSFAAIVNPAASRGASRSFGDSWLASACIVQTLQQAPAARAGLTKAAMTGKWPFRRAELRNIRVAGYPPMLHLVRIFEDWPVIIGDWSVPKWVSWAGAIVAGVLAIFGFRFTEDE